MSKLSCADLPYCHDFPGTAAASADIIPVLLASPSGKDPHWQVLSKTCPQP